MGITKYHYLLTSSIVKGLRFYTPCKLAISRMLISRRYEIPESEAMESLLLIATALTRIPAFVMVSWVPIPIGQCKESQLAPANEVGCATEEDSQVQGSPIF